MVNTDRTSASEMCSVMWDPENRGLRKSPASRLALARRALCDLRLLRLQDVSFADSPNYRLDHFVGLLFAALRLTKTKLRLPFFVLADANGHLPARVILNECRFVATAPSVPGVHPEVREVARLAFRPARRGKQVLRHVAGLSWNAVQLKPRDRPEIRGIRSLANRIRHVQLDEARHNPSRHGHRLVSGFRGCLRDTAARRR